MIIQLTEEEEEIFTDLQKNVLRAKEHMTYEQIIANFPELKTPKIVTEFLEHTLKGNRYEVGNKGRMPLVGDVQMRIFEKHVEFAADNNRAIMLFDAITLLQEIEGNYLFQNYKRAEKIGCLVIGQRLLNDIEKDLSTQWLTSRIRKLGFEIKNSQSLEMTRHKFCHTEVLRIFYENFISTLPTNPDLIYNADETASSFNRKGKVIVPNGHFPIRYEGQVSGHFTSICCFNASGNHVLPPFIILPKLRRIPDDLKSFRQQAMFASAPNGWITNKLFIGFVMYFVNLVSQFRVQTQNFDTVWLIVDGHKSRCNSLAVEFCVQHNVKLLVLPAHTSHVTQPFDVGLASPMKREIRALIERPSTHMDNLIKHVQSETAKQRVKIVGAIINAWHRVATPTNCASAFAKAGIFPYDLEKVLQNKFVRQSDGDEPEPPQRGILLNGLEITHNLKRLQLASAFHQQQFRNVTEIPKISIFYLRNLLRNGAEILLDNLPLYHEQVMPGIVFHY